MQLRFALIFTLLSVSFTSRAQIDRQFWFAVPEVSEDHADRPIRLHFSAQNQDANITISIPTNNQFTPIQVSLAAHSSTIVELTDWIDMLENTVYNAPQNKGLLIESDFPITTYYEVLGGYPQSYNNDIFSLKGNNALGNEFYTPFQASYENEDVNAWSSIDVVATEDSTVINFELTNDAYNQNSRTFSVVLNRGQTYSVRCNSRYENLKLDGSRVTSNKPIAVTLKDDSVLGMSGHNYDLIGDQIVPTDVIGDEYIITPGEVFILSTENNTTVSVNGTQQSLIDAGETYTFNVVATSYITASAPVYAWQIIQTGSEYGGALIPAITCAGSYEVNFNRTTNEQFVLIVIVEAGGENNFLLNDAQAFISGNEFQNVLGTNGQWKYLLKAFNDLEIPTGQNSKIENATSPFQLGFYNGSEASGNRYGYFSNYDVLNLGINFDACDNTILQVPAGLDSYQWSDGSTNNTLNVDTTGTYWVYATEGGCEATDTVFVQIKPGVEHTFLGDTFLCSDSGITLTIPFDTSYSYQWNTGDTTHEIIAYGDSVYFVTVINEFDCSITDKIEVTSQVLKEYALNDSVICDDEITLTIQDNALSFYWLLEGDTLSKESYFTIDQAGTYTLVRKSNCGVETDDIVIEKRNVLPPNIVTPNEDIYNNSFIVELGMGQWNFNVFNRWGKEVYIDENFKGTWTPSGLSDGIYYYSLLDHYCDEKVKGWFQIQR